MKTHEELVEQVETLEKVINVILKKDLCISLPIMGGGDDGMIQNVPLKVVLGELMKKFNLTPTFKKEIVFTEEKLIP